MTGGIRMMTGAVAVVFVTVATALAQDNGRMSGVVSGTDGSPRANVTVTVAGAPSVASVSRQTAGDGTYVFLGLVPGTYDVTFTLAGHRPVRRLSVEVTFGSHAIVDATLEPGRFDDPVVDRTPIPLISANATTRQTFSRPDTFLRLPVARDPWQFINLAPGVEAGVSVGGASSGQQVALNARGSAANVHWLLDGGAVTDLASNSSGLYYNVDTLSGIAVTTTGGDASRQAAGLLVNLLTRSGGNTFAGMATGTFQDARLQSNNVSGDLLDMGPGGVLSGAPLRRLTTASLQAGGPLQRNHAWWWAAADRQDINAGVLNFFDPTRGSDCAVLAETQRSAVFKGAATPPDISVVQRCLADDVTVIENRQIKLSGVWGRHRAQYQVISADKRRTSRGASADTAPEATTRQVADRWTSWLPVPTHLLSHTWDAGAVIVDTRYTFLGAGFFLDYQDSGGPCGLSRYTGGLTMADAAQSARADCLFNVQPLVNTTTNHQSRSLRNSYHTTRRSHEFKTDGIAVIPTAGIGRHTLKFGAGYRRAPVRSYSHFSGGGRAEMQCAGNLEANCDGAALVPRAAVLARDSLVNNDWWTWSGYLQDSIDIGQVRVTAGLRFDRQHSKHLGGCVPANPVAPSLLPAQCDEPTFSAPSPIGPQEDEIRPYLQWAPRASAAWNVGGRGRTVLRAGGAYYYATRVVLANALSGLGAVTLTWGPNLPSGACRNFGSCWTDANRDGVVAREELIGAPTVSASLFNLSTGVLAPTGNRIVRDAQPGRTREVTVSVEQALTDHLVSGVTGVYRRYDRGFATYANGTQPGGARHPMSQFFSGPFTHVDPATGLSAPYYRLGLVTPSSGPSITTTRETFESYRGLDVTLDKRYADGWHAGLAVTIQSRDDHSPQEALPTGDPTGNEFFDGRNAIARYVIKVQGSYDLPWGLQASTQLNINDGAIRNRVIAGPQTSSTTQTLYFEPTGSTRFDRVTLWDVGLEKSAVVGGSRTIRMRVDGFNLLNRATVSAYESDNISLGGTTVNPVRPSERITALLAPRVLRFGVTIVF